MLLLTPSGAVYRTITDCLPHVHYLVTPRLHTSRWQYRKFLPGVHSYASCFLVCRAGSAGARFARRGRILHLQPRSFQGSTALTDPGRQIVAGEASINFNIAADTFRLGQFFFGVGDDVLFANDVVGNIATSGLNTIVLRTFDNDNDPATAFGAGNAANLLAARITTDAPGFFIYFNSGLNVPRLVFSTNLSDPTADLKILFRLTNLTGDDGRNAMANFTAANFDFIPQEVTPVPEPATLLLLGSGTAFLIRKRARRQKHD